jgi:hypothetical protein
MTESKTVSLAEIPDIGNNQQLSEPDIARRIERYISNLKRAEIQVPAHNNLIGFFELLQNAIRSREASQKVPAGKGLLILAQDPPEEIDTEAVTFFLSSRSPGLYGKGPMGAGGVHEVVPHLRSVQDHPEHAGEKLVTMGRSFDNVVRLRVYARDDMTALKRVFWLEDVIDSFRWYFRVHGIFQVLEMGVGEKEQVTIGELLLTRYPMSYFVKTEDIYQFGSQELKKVELNTAVTTGE